VDERDNSNQTLMIGFNKRETIATFSKQSLLAAHKNLLLMKHDSRAAPSSRPLSRYYLINVRLRWFRRTRAGIYGSVASRQPKVTLTTSIIEAKAIDL
jgi:hypothetical protein